MTPSDKNNKKKHKREKLPMEIKFDKWVYGGISYWAQALTGMGIAYWMKYGSGKPIFEKAAEWTGKNIMSKITGKTGAAAVKEAHTTVTVSTMIMVGNTFLLPVKWLENRKPAIVRKWTEDENKSLEKAGTPISEEGKKRQEAAERTRRRSTTKLEIINWRTRIWPGRRLRRYLRPNTKAQ